MVTHFELVVSLFPALAVCLTALMGIGVPKFHTNLNLLAASLLFGSAVLCLWVALAESVSSHTEEAPASSAGRCLAAD